MGIVNNLTSDVTKILATRWETREGRVVPDAEDITLGNNAVKLDGTVLYADLADSTGLVKAKSAAYAAEVFKCYLHCASKIIEHYNGVITAFDGDRVMAVYIGDRKNSNAARSALAINHAVVKIINPKIEAQYPGKGYTVSRSALIPVLCSSPKPASAGPMISCGSAWRPISLQSCARCGAIPIRRGLLKRFTIGYVKM